MVNYLNLLAQEFQFLRFHVEHSTYLQLEVNLRNQVSIYAKNLEQYAAYVAIQIND